MNFQVVPLGGRGILEPQTYLAHAVLNRLSYLVREPVAVEFDTYDRFVNGERAAEETCSKTNNAQYYKDYDRRSEQ